MNLRDSVELGKIKPSDDGGKAGGAGNTPLIGYRYRNTQRPAMGRKHPIEAPSRVKEK